MKQLVINALAKATNLSKAEIATIIESPPSSDMGDFAFPCFSLAKIEKKNPNEISFALSQKIKSEDFEKVIPQGPYINFFINRSKMAKSVLSEILKKNKNYGKSKIKNEKTMIEFSQANTHKAFHIGHVRGTALGESLSRISEFLGNKTVRANYQGDTGMHVAKWIWCYEKYHKKQWLKKDESWIASIYVEAVKRLIAKPELQEEVNEINRKLDSRESKPLNELWKKTRSLSLNSLESIYKELNTKFDKYFFESEVEKKGREIAKKLTNQKLAEVSDGATIINLEKWGLGIWVLLRADGTVLYSSKDLALAEKKFKDYKIEKSIYVVGSAQRLHILQLFKTLELMKFKEAKNCAYVPVTEVRLPEGKMSSRTGDNVLYSSFKDVLVEEVKKEIKKRDSSDTKDIEKRALTIAISSLKYSMLKQDTNKTLIFDKSEALNFEGNTGPYLLYTYARAKSILRKSKKKSRILPKDLTEKEKSLVLELSKFPEVILSAYSSLSPSLIANYSYSLAQKFNEFYHSTPVLGSIKEPFLLSLVESVSIVLKTSLSLLGISVLEKM